MNLSRARWTLACLLGCALIAVTFLPAGYDNSDPLKDYWWQPTIRIRESKMRDRYNIMWQHTRLLDVAYKAATDIETANRVFGTHHEIAGAPIVWYGPDITPAVRARVDSMIASERAAAGEWTGHGAVGVMVVSDTASTIGGFRLPTFYDRDRVISEVVLPPTPANGNHCVTVVRLRHHAFDARSALSSDRLPLDGCAFTDAYGAPGPQIAEWLRNTRYRYARRLSYAPPDSAGLKRPWFWFDEGDENSKRCRAGIDSACVTVASSMSWRDDWVYWRPDLSVAVPVESVDLYGEIGGDPEAFMEAMVRDVGSARFQRLWQSPKPLADAYFDETGTTLATFIRARQTYFHGPYHIGPMQRPSSAFLTVLSILILAAIAVRFAPRPYKI